MSIRLITDIPAKIIIFDEGMNLQFMTEIPYNYKFYLHTVSLKVEYKVFFTQQYNKNIFYIYIN